MKYWLLLNRRERWIVALGALCLVVVLPYFFIIQPLNVKTQQLQQTAITRMSQLTDMQSMARQLSGRTTVTDAKTLLDGLIASESLENGQRVLVTQPISLAKAKQLLIQLAPLGKITLKQQQDALQLWFIAN